MCKREAGVLIPVAIVFIIGFLAPSWAGNSLLDQGSSLLKSMNSDSGSSSSSSSSSLSTSDIVSGLKEALQTGANTVVNQLGTENGFNSDSNIHIPLPSYLSNVKKFLNKAGMGSYAEDVELKLNRAAEAATPKAKELFVNAITGMSIDDAKGILNGEDDAATQYFKEKTSTSLTEAFKPVVESTLEEVGAIKSYDQMIEKYKALPFVPNVKGNLADYAVEEALDGIFYYLAKEEKAIRENPAKQTTELLKKLFTN